jgi:hypothetical protein
MLFADVVSDFLGNACLLVIVIGALLCYALRGIAKSAKDVIESDEFREGVRLGLWFMADDDADDDDDDWDD